MTIVLGNPIPGRIGGASFNGLANRSPTLTLELFLCGIPEADAGAVMLTRAGDKASVIFAWWATVLLAGMVPSALEKVLVGKPESLAAVFREAVAGSAVLALMANTMIPARGPRRCARTGGRILVRRSSARRTGLTDRATPCARVGRRFALSSDAKGRRR